MGVDVNRLTESINRFDETSIKLKEVSDLVKDSIAVKDDMNSSINKINEEVDNLGKENKKNLKSLETALANKTQELYDSNVRNSEKMIQTINSIDDKLDSLVKRVDQIEKDLKNDVKSITELDKNVEEKFNKVQTYSYITMALLVIVLIAVMAF